MTPEEMVARLLYRDGLMLIVDKPAGFAVHKGPKGGESLEDHFDALRFGLPRAPALAHRLDRDTSGCLVLGRHRKALAELGRLFKQGRVGKTYWAVVEGGPAEMEGRIDLPLGRLDESRGWWMKPDPHGQPAVDDVEGAGADGCRRERSSCGWQSRCRERPLPPCGGGQGGGYAKDACPDHPPPQPSPSRGEGADRASGEEAATQVGLNATAAHLAGARAADRADASAARALRRDGLADRRRYDLRKRSAHRRAAPASARARGRGAALQEPRADRGVAPVPLHMHATLQACGWQGEVFRLVD